MSNLESVDIDIHTSGQSIEYRNPEQWERTSVEDYYSSIFGFAIKELLINKF